MNRATSSPTPRRSAPAQGHRYPGASTNPLTKKQKGIICEIAGRAFRHRGEVGKLEDWRREQQFLAVKQRSLTACGQSDFLPLVAHFEGLAGEGGRQFNAALRNEDEAKRQARFNLEVALNDRELDITYAEAICRDTYKCALDDAEPAQLTNVIYTVKARRKVGAAAAASADPF